jgi:hypothetical protein
MEIIPPFFPTFWTPKAADWKLKPFTPSGSEFYIWHPYGPLRILQTKGDPDPPFV